MTAPFTLPRRVHQTRRLLPAALVALGLASGGPSRAEAAAPADQTVLELPITIRVARCQGAPVRSQQWVVRHVERANELFASQRIRLLARYSPFTPASCELITAAERSALARHVEAGQATVLVVRRIQDLALPSYDLMGVHWRYRGGRSAWQGRRWIYLTARAKPPVLAHELAHFLGLPHDPAGGNLMTPGPSDPIWRQEETGQPAPYAPLLTAAQGRQLRRAVRRLLAPRAAPAPGAQRREAPTAAPPTSGAAPYPPR